MARTSSPSSSSAFLLGQDTDCVTRREHKRGWGFVYGAPKSGFHRIAEFIHVEHAKDGVLSFNVEPGHTVTEATVAMFGPDSAVSFNRHASRPEATGDVVAWLATQPEAKELAGSMIAAPGFFKSRGISFP